MDLLKGLAEPFFNNRSPHASCEGLNNVGGAFPGGATAFIVFMCDLCPALDLFFFFGMLFCASMPFLHNCLCF